MPSSIIMNGHLDLAMNAIEWNRRYNQEDVENIFYKNCYAFFVMPGGKKKKSIINAYKSIRILDLK